MSINIPCRYFLDYSISSFQSKASAAKLLTNICNIKMSQLLDHIYIPIYGGLGDAVPALVFASKIRTIHNLKKHQLKLIVSETKKELLPLFKNDFSSCIFTEDKIFDSIAPLTGFQAGQVAFSTKGYIAGGILEPLISAHSIAAHDIIKASFKLPLTLSYEYSLSIDFKAAHKELLPFLPLLESNSKIALLFPYASHGKRISTFFWKKLANSLTSMGFLVFTNTLNKTASLCRPHILPQYDALPGTSPLPLSLNALCALYHKFRVHSFHSQSGICHLTALLPAVQRTVIYHPVSIPKSHFTSSCQSNQFITPSTSWDALGPQLQGRFTELSTNQLTKDYLKHMICHEF